MTAGLSGKCSSCRPAGERVVNTPHMAIRYLAEEHMGSGGGRSGQRRQPVIYKPSLSHLCSTASAFEVEPFVVICPSA